MVEDIPEIVCECDVVLFHWLGGRKGLLPTPDEFPRFEGGRKPESWDGNREPGKEELPVGYGNLRPAVHKSVVRGSLGA